MSEFRIKTLCALLVILLVIMASVNAGAQSSTATRITVMSQNLYVGADMTTLLASTSPSQLFARMAAVFSQVKATNFNQRAAAVAEQIEAFKPALIGLQEVALWRSDSPADGPFTPATHVEYDFLRIIQTKLENRGLHYDVVATFWGFDFECPAMFVTGLKDIRFTDRDVVLARRTTRYEFSNPRTGRFEHEFGLAGGVFESLGGSGTYPRGWESVDVRIVGTSKRIRFINTHLEAFSSSVRNAQATELIAGPGDTNLPVILAGDFNAAPGQTAYNRFINAGFRDAWSLVHGSSGGRTCCQDANLANAASELSVRIDLVLVRGALTPAGVQLVGEVAADKTASGLWPSDHAGVIARIDRN